MRPKTAPNPIPWCRAPHTSFLRVGFLTFLASLFWLTFAYTSSELSIREIDRQQPIFSFFMRPKTAPNPIPGIPYQPSFHRIGVHVLEFLSNLFRAIHVEVIEPRLPKLR